MTRATSSVRFRTDRNNRGYGIGSNGARGTKLVGQNPVPLISENAVAIGISEKVVGFSAKDLARVTGKSVEAAKSWKSGERTMNSAQLINMARAIPAVREWLRREIEGAEVESTEYLTKLVAAEVRKHLKP